MIMLWLYTTQVNSYGDDVRGDYGNDDDDDGD